MNDRQWEVLRLGGIVLMGITAVFTIMGGAGTTCVAFNPAGFGGKFNGIAPYQWLYILFVLVTLAFGVMGARAVYLLIRNRPNAYRYALIALIGGSIIGVIHIVASRVLRGGSMPVDMVTYTSVLTLVVFLLFRIPGIWEHLGFGKSTPSNTSGMAGGMASITWGAIVLTIQYWMGPTHTIAGVNYANAWHLPLQLVGWLFALLGAYLLLQCVGIFSRQMPERRAISA